MAQNPISQNVIDILQSEAATTRALRQQNGQVQKPVAPAAQTPTVTAGRKVLGAALGFCLGAALMVCAAYVYVYAADVTDQFPQFAHQVNAYVLWVADLRAMLEQQLGDVI